MNANMCKLHVQTTKARAFMILTACALINLTICWTVSRGMPWLFDSAATFKYFEAVTSVTVPNGTSTDQVTVGSCRSACRKALIMGASSLTSGHETEPSQKLYSDAFCTSPCSFGKNHQRPEGIFRF